MAKDFAVGQEWSYKTRPQDSGSTLIIVQIDKNKKLGNIIHISLVNVNVKNPTINGDSTKVLPHSPVSEESVRKSVIEYKGMAKTLPPYQEGYKTWKQAFDNGKAGVFTIPVSEIVEVIEKTLNQ